MFNLDSYYPLPDSMYIQRTPGPDVDWISVYLSEPTGPDVDSLG